jgi:hypothetical protein
VADIRNIINKMKVPVANKNNPYTKNGIPNVNLAETAQFVNSFIPISGDVQSGLLAFEDVKQGNYGSAALNSLGLLPFVPSIGGTIKSIKELNSLNPTGGLYVDYTPNVRASQPLGSNMVSIDKTMGGNPDDIITIYRGAPKKQKKIVPGDFITDMPELAKAYTGDGNVLSMKVRRGDVLDDIREPLGNEYIYRPNADKFKP